MIDGRFDPELARLFSGHAPLDEDQGAVPARAVLLTVYAIVVLLSLGGLLLA